MGVTPDDVRRLRSAGMPVEVDTLALTRNGRKRGPNPNPNPRPNPNPHPIRTPIRTTKPAQPLTHCRTVSAPSGADAPGLPIAPGEMP